jgi:mRNA interferase MazF
MNYNKWDIVLVPFPFTDLSTTKKRPALVVSPDEFNAKYDLVIAFITSQINLENRIGDYRIKEWRKSNLPKPSMIRMKFTTVDQSIIIKKLGRLSTNDSNAFRRLLIDLFN